MMPIPSPHLKSKQRTRIQEVGSLKMKVREFKTCQQFGIFCFPIMPKRSLLFCPSFVRSRKKAISVCWTTFEILELEELVRRKKEVKMRKKKVAQNLLTIQRNEILGATIVEWAHTALQTLLLCLSGGNVHNWYIYLLTPCRIRDQNRKAINKKGRR